ncbi:hypothetical protein LSAT2_012615, partial [Lamellibrachia satsuma]
MDEAETCLIRCLTEDRNHLGELLLQLTKCDLFQENLVILVNTGLRERIPCVLYSDYTPLGYAIIKNDPQAVDLLLSYGACAQSLPCKPKDNNLCVLSPLHLALKHLCQPTIVDTLLKKGASTKNIQSRDVSCLLGFIAKCPSKETSEALISDISCLNRIDNDRRTLLHLAAINGKCAVVSTVLNSHQVDIDQFDATGKTALLYAAERNSPNTIQLLLDGGATVDLTDAWGRTALHFAVRRASLKTVELLASAGANVCAEDMKGLTPLNYAYSNGNILHCRKPSENAKDLIQCIVRSTRKPISLCKREFLLVAFLLISESEPVMIKLLEENNSHVSQRNDDGQMLIHVAAEFNKHRVVKWLLEKDGFNSNTPDAAGWQPLHYAAKGGNRETLFYLLEQHGADVNIATPSGWTPLWILARNGWTDLAYDVVRYGCDTEQTLAVSAIRQADSQFSLPLSLFDPETQSVQPVEFALTGARRIKLVEFATECRFSKLAQ